MFAAIFSSLNVRKRRKGERAEFRVEGRKEERSEDITTNIKDEKLLREKCVKGLIYMQNILLISFVTSGFGSWPQTESKMPYQHWPDSQALQSCGTLNCELTMMGKHENSHKLVENIWPVLARLREWRGFPLCW
jgi:hypothetical protein